MNRLLSCRILPAVPEPFVCGNFCFFMAAMAVIIPACDSLGDG